jgi:hypothetical protein
MKLQNVLRHMANASVLVNGNRYFLDEKGITTVDNAEDAKKIMMDRTSWRHYVEDDVPAAEQPKVEEKKPLKSKSEASKPEPKKDEVEVADTKTDAEAEEKGSKTEEYPDPSMAMSLVELKELADVYHVNRKDQPNKSVLVERIMVAMYPPEEE